MLHPCTNEFGVDSGLDSQLLQHLNNLNTGIYLLDNPIVKMTLPFSVQ